MAIYTFKAYLGDDKNVHRYIQILDNQSLKDLHHTMMKAFDLNRISGVAFYTSTGKWKKDQKITPVKTPGDKKAIAMDEATIGKLIHTEKDTLIYECKTTSPWTFKLEVTGINRKESGEGRFPKWEDRSGLTLTNRTKSTRPASEDEDFEEFAQEDDFGKGFDELKIEDEREEEIADEPADEDQSEKDY